MVYPNDRVFAPIASVTLSASQGKAALSGVQPRAIPLPTSTAGHKLATVGRAELPKSRARGPQGPKNKWFLNKAGISRRWLTGIGVGAGGLTFVRIRSNSVAHSSS